MISMQNQAGYAHAKVLNSRSSDGKNSDPQNNCGKQDASHADDEIPTRKKCRHSFGHSHGYFGPAAFERRCHRSGILLPSAHRE